MKISINIPSYKRPYVKTLEYIKNARVWVCESELDQYLVKNPAESIVAVPIGVQGNVSRIRNYILDKEFERGMDAVCIIDDDMDGIYAFSRVGNYGYSKYLIQADQVEEWIEDNTHLCNEYGFKLWGVNINGDPKAYRQYTPINTNKIILGPFSVHLNNELRYDEELPLKEDYDIALQHMMEYGGILRLNGYHYICKQSTNTGGCAGYRNMSREREQFELLQKKWGTKIIRIDKSSIKKFDYNPIIKVPIKGV